jgi:surfeit locus 1 family protein
MKPRIWPILLASGIGLAILLALGVWQVKRLAWKNALIASVEASLKGEPVSLGKVLDRWDSDEDVSYTKVSESGHFLPGHDILVLTTANGGAAWSVVRAFIIKESPYDGDIAEIVLVDCGKSLSQTPSPPPIGEVTVEGVVRFHPGYKGFFDPANNPDAKQWYWWDIPAMLKAIPSNGSKLDLFAVSLLPNSPGTEGLIVEPPKVELRNNHLGYAITWFGLAAALLVMTGVFVMRIKHAP